MDIGMMRKLGFTDSEAKVYLALIEIGPITKGPLVKKAGISSSKIYEVIDKLIEKGLASVFLKNGVKHFSAAPPSKIGEYLEEKKENIEKEEKIFQNLLPQLKARWGHIEAESDAEVFRGWRGLKTVYNDILDSLEKGETDYVLGASKGYEPEKVRNFFNWFNLQRHKRGVKIRIIFSESARGNIPTIGHPKYDEVKYMDNSTPSEINIYGNKTAVVVLSKEPLAILIRGKEVADSFREYFNVMWAVSKK
jgi:sugar-specific transcriptional regulator TrmB